MKKRMIAWLLCACMTLTAAPEMLLADVAGKEHQQTQEENSFKEKETVETQTAEQDDEKSTVTEKKETDQADEEDHNAGSLAEEESGMAETKIVTEEAEDSDAEIVTEETEINESESAGNVWTSESEVMEDSETGIVTEETAETEQVETETVTEETESIELTAEEQEQIEQEVMDEISFFSASDSYSLTEEQLCMLAPSYLNNQSYDDIIAKCGDMSLEAINSVSATDETVASFMYSIKTGSSVLWSEFWSKCNLGDNTYESFEKQAARKVVYEYLQANQNLTKTAGEVEKNLKVVNKVYDFLKDKDKEAYRKTLVENNKNKLMSDEKIGEMVDGLYENMDMFMKFTNDTNEIFLMVSGMIEIQEIEVQAIDDLMIVHEHVKDPSIYNELIALRNEIVENPAQYIVDNYLSDKVLSALQKEAKKAAGSIVSGVFDYSNLPWGIVNKAAGMIASVYEHYNPSVSDIVYSSLLYQYWMDSNRAVAHYQHLFYTGKGTTDDMRYLEAAVNFNAACTKMLLSKSKNLVKSRDKRLYSKMDCWESSMGSEVNYELYINSCLSNATKAVQDGTLTIKDDSVTIRDNNGNVIDENYDSTASIKAKFAAIQSQYKPNVGQTWNGDWGGAIQCFGFARMVFYQLFGCNMPNRYYGNAKYKYQSEENVDLVGQISGSSVTTDSAKNLLQQGKLGDIIQACGSGNGGQHTMVFVSADDNGVTVYDCNARLSASEPACVIHQWTIKWSTWASYYGTSDSSSENGISLYRASNYAQIYGDGDGMFYDDSVNFVIENGVLKKYNGWQTFVEIPDTVTSIGDEAFKNNTSMVSVSIPDSVKSIGDSAFYGCTSLLGVVIPDSVEKTGRCAFQKCSKLASAYLPVNEKFTYMNVYMFESCTSLKKIEIPDNVTDIDGNAFAECKELTDVKLSKNLKTMGWQVFGNDNKLNEIEIPKSLEECRYSVNSAGIDGGAFDNCANLKTVTFEEGTTEIAEGLFAGCTGIEQITIPNTVTVIESGAFGGCINLKEIDVPNSVTEIQRSAFEYCSSLKTAKLSGNLESIGVYAFDNCTSLTEVHLSNILKEIPSSTFSGCKKLTTINFPSTLTTIGNSAFSGCESLPEAILPSGVEKIESNAFKNCKSLKKAVVPDTVSSIGSSAFYGCEALTDITLGSKLKKIESQTFYGCTALPSIMIPYNVTTIGDSAFVNCTKLTQITVPRNTTSIASNAFSYPKKMTMYGPSDCYAQTYASGKGIKYVTQDIHATSVSLDITEKTAERYDDFQLTATIAPLNFTDAVVWTSSNEEVAAVSDTGYVEICGVGTAVITVTAGNVKAACKITVPQLIDWIEFDEDEIELKAGQTYQLKPYISPSDATNKKLKYTSSDTKVAEVSASGLVTAKSEGEAKIRATATDGSDEYAVCYVTVTGKAKVTGITLDRTSAEVKRGEKLTLNVTVSPSYASNKKVVWKSANTKIATVDANGSVTAKAPGRTKITVTSSENSSYQASCTVTVPYKITYKLNKGKNNASNPSTYYGKKVTLKNPSRKGYAFAGWYTDAKFKKKITSISSSAKSDYILYAKWTKVKVAKASLTSAKNSKSKQILLKYKKVSGAKGYEISYSTDKKFKKAVTKKNTAKTSYTISKLKKGKTYYVRIRAYKVDSTGKKVYGKYSSVKKVKISK